MGKRSGKPSHLSIHINIMAQTHIQQSSYNNYYLVSPRDHTSSLFPFPLPASLFPLLSLFPLPVVPFPVTIPTLCFAPCS